VEKEFQKLVETTVVLKKERASMEKDIPLCLLRNGVSAWMSKHRLDLRRICTQNLQKKSCQDTDSFSKWEGGGSPTEENTSRWRSLYGDLQQQAIDGADHVQDGKSPAILFA
jgi:hypothetical protein